jgi:hypothetical protein
VDKVMTAMILVGGERSEAHGPGRFDLSRVREVLSASDWVVHAEARHIASDMKMDGEDHDNALILLLSSQSR